VAGAYEAVTLSRLEFSCWARIAGTHLPFPINASGVTRIVPPDDATLSRLRRTVPDAVPSRPAAALLSPRLVVHAVRLEQGRVADETGRETYYVAVAGQGDEAVVLVIDGDAVRLHEVAEHELVPTLVAELPALRPAPVPGAQVPVAGLEQIETAIAGGEPEERVGEMMQHAGFPAELARFRLRRIAERPVLGAFGAEAHSGDASAAAQQALYWQEFESGALLVAQRRGNGEPVAHVGPYVAADVIRAGVDMVAGLHAPQREVS
jgi:hypothetical protein